MPVDTPLLPSPLCVSHTPCSLCAVSLHLPRKHEKITPVMKASFPITIMHHRTTSPRSKLLRLVSGAKKDRGMGFLVLAAQETK